MNNWSAPQRPNAYAERALLEAILDGAFQPGTTLPGERSLAAQLGVTRPTLREAIQRLSRDGWLTVRQGKPTVVNDYWRDGGLNVLNTLVHHGGKLPAGFVSNLLDVRLHLAPAYARAAVIHDPEPVVQLLNGRRKLVDDPSQFAHFDWELHRQLTLSSGNSIYTLILNGFADFYEQLARVYFVSAESRNKSRVFYDQLDGAFKMANADLAERVCREAMLESIHLWRQTRSRPDTHAVFNHTAEANSEQGG